MGDDGDCLNDTEVAALLGRVAAPALHARAFTHAADCDPCRQLLAGIGRMLAAERKASADAHTEPTFDSGDSLAGFESNAVATRVGSRLGRYTLRREVGRGGMGVVYEAYDPELARRVAVKVLHDADASKLARMSREAQAVAALSHPNVVQIFDVSVTDEPAFIVMEFVEGSTLRDWIHDQRPHWRSALQAYLQAALGLAAAHAAGLVHRDFKPSNAIIDAAGCVKVLDFGLARSDAESSVSSGGELPIPFASTTLTATGVAVGTPSYMAPEQHRGERVDARADIYGLGVALHEALYDRLPFEARSVELLFLQKQRGPEGEPPQSPIPSAIHAAILKALAYDPDDRWSTMESFAAALSSAVHRRRPKAWVLAGIAATALAGAAIVERSPSTAAPGPTAAAIDAGLAIEAIDAITRSRRESEESGLGSALAAATLAAASGSLRVKAHAEIQVGRRLVDTRRWTLALDWLGDGIANATEAGDDRAAALGTLASMDALNELHRPAEALDAGRQARSLVQRIVDDGTLLAAVLAGEARALPDGDPDKVARYEQSLAMRRAHPKLDPLALAATLNNTAAAWGGLDDDRAHALFSEALQIRERVQGRDHPKTLLAAFNLAVLEYELGNHGDCVAQGIRVHTGLPEAEQDARALSAQLVAICSVHLHAVEPGIEWIDRALAIQAALDPEGKIYATMLETKAALLTHRREWAEVEALLQRAIVIHEAAASEPTLALVHSRHKLSVATRELGELDRAEAYARRALSEAEVLGDRAGILLARTEIAHALHDAGHHAEAVDVLAAHLDLPADALVDPMLVAEAKAVYARASWDVGDRPRAIELAHEALDALARRRDFLAEHDEVEIWLASRPH